MRLRRIATAVLLFGITGAVAYIAAQGNEPSHDSSPHISRQTFTVHRTTTITQEAGSLTLHFTGTHKVVVAAESTTDKGYFSLECVGRSAQFSVPGNGQRMAIDCRLAAVHYSDNDPDTGEIILTPRN